MYWTIEEAIKIGEEIGIDWDKVTFDPAMFQLGLDVELEHGTTNSQTNITDDDPHMTGKIAWAHLTESPEYYRFLLKAEEMMQDEDDRFAPTYIRVRGRQYRRSRRHDG